MARALILALVSALLAGCWVSQKPLFGSADWVRPPGIAGRYTSENADGEPQGSVVLAVRADGMIDGTVIRKGETEPRTSPAGFIAIPGGSGAYFLMVHRAPDGASDGKGGELYLIARARDDGIEASWPGCAGTPDMPGMAREQAEPIGETMCAFASKDAVLRAALLAERELATKRMFEPQSLGRLRRVEDAGSKVEDD